MFRPNEERLYAVVLTLSDVTDRIELDRLKSQFVSTVSHELRTPLTAIQGSLRLLTSGAGGELPDSASRMLEMAQHNTARLVRLVNDILDLQRMESRTEKLIYGTCRDTRLLDDVAALMAPLADEAQVALELDPAGLSFSADGDRLLQTLSNLVGNAIKFTEPGGRITITTEQKGDDIVFSITDTGRGIPSDKLESIFGRFQQVEASDSRSKGGTGLGLAICKRIVEGHGGTIRATSTLGEGSTFRFTVPMRIRQHRGGARSGRHPEHRGGRRSDDASADPDHRRRGRHPGSGADGARTRVRVGEVDTAGSGPDGASLAAAGAPDAILLDVMMPEVDGPATLELLRSDPVTASIPVVFLTARAQAADVRVVDRAGRRGVLAKPFDPVTLADDVARVLGWSVSS